MDERPAKRLVRQAKNGGTGGDSHGRALCWVSAAGRGRGARRARALSSPPPVAEPCPARTSWLERSVPRRRGNRDGRDGRSYPATTKSNVLPSRSEAAVEIG